MRIMTTDVRFTIMIPTCGRDTLKRTLESILANGYAPGDEVIVVGDGPQPGVPGILEGLDERLAVTYVESPPDHFWGHPQRNVAMRLATGTHLVSIDDDDEYVADGLSAMRSAASENPGKILIFRMDGPRFQGAPPIWVDKEIRLANVGTPAFVVPNIPGQLGEWGRRYAGDFDFITSTVEKWPGGKDAVVWVDKIVLKINH